MFRGELTTLRPRRPIDTLVVAFVLSFAVSDAPRAQSSRPDRDTPARASAVVDDLVEIVMREDRREVDATLIGYTENDDPSLRARAALAIGRVGRAVDVAVLEPLLADGVVEVRRVAAFALGEIEDSTAAPPLVARLQSGEESDPAARGLAIEALGKLGRGPDVISAALSDPAAEVRVRALLAAWRVPGSDAVVHALDMFEDPDPEIRWPAAYCLMRLAGSSPSGRTAIPSADALSDEDRARVREALLWATRDADARVRLQAIRGLRRYGDREVTAAVRARAIDSDWRVRVEVTRALASDVDRDEGTSPREVGIEAVAPLLRDRHPNVRVAAVEALATIGAAPDAFALLEPLLEDPRPRIRQVAFAAMTTRWSTSDADPDAIATLCGRTLDGAHWSVRALVPPAAELLPAARALPILERVVADEDTRVVKLGVGPYLTLLAKERTGPLWSRIDDEVDRFGASSDPMVELMTISTLGELFEADSVFAATDEDWRTFEEHLGRAYARSVSSGGVADVREAIAGVAATFADRPAMARTIRGASFDPAHVVRRSAAAAMLARGEEPHRSPEPVETGRSAEEYRTILDWAASEHWAEVDTDAGRIAIRLLGEVAPLTCWNFATLAGDGWYDDGSWHRVVPNFVLQDGCPRGDGWGGPDWQIRCEINRNRFTRGTVGMALSGKDTGGSQFFLTHSAQPHLDGGYTVFGQVVSGMSVADRVLQSDGILTIRILDAPPASVTSED